MQTGLTDVLESNVIPQQIAQLKRRVRRLKLDGFRHIIELGTVEDMDAVTGFIRDPLYKRSSHQ